MSIELRRKRQCKTGDGCDFMDSFACGFEMQSRVLGNPSPTSSLRPLSKLRVAHSSNWDPHGLPKQRSIESRKKRCKISQLLKPLSTSPGHFSDRTFFVTPAVTQLSSLLSVINIDSLFVCLQIALLSFILLLCSGKLPLRRTAKLAFHNEKPRPAISDRPQ